MRPRVLFFGIFAWYACSGGRFFALFLQDECGGPEVFTDAIIGISLAVARVTSSLMSPLGGAAADYFERNHPERGGRAVVLAAGILIGTASFMLHAAVPGGKVGYHVFLMMTQSVGGAMTYPVIDGLTLGFLEETGEGRDSYGKERLYGAISWAVANMCLGMLIDILGFKVMYAASLFTCVAALTVVYMFAFRTDTNKTGKEGAQINCPDSAPCNSDFQNISTRKNNTKASFEIEATPLTQITSVISETESAEHKSEERGNVGMSTLCGNLFCGSRYACAFVFSTFLLTVGISNVENLVFLFFRDLGGNNTMCGLSVVITVVFELPIFHFAPKLLKKYGMGRLEQLACLAYVVRVIGYTLVPPSRAFLVLLLEPLHGVTYACDKTSSVEFVARSTPKGHEAAGQGILSALKDGGGSFLGLTVGGLLEQTYGPRVMYRTLATAVTIGLVLFSLADRYETVNYDTNSAIEKDENETRFCTNIDCTDGDEIS